MNRGFFRPPHQIPLLSILRGGPQAVAYVAGSKSAPELSGVVRFYQTPWGVLVYAEIQGLPPAAPERPGRFFGFHLHQGNTCGGTAEDPFALAGSHFDLESHGHPDHAGDFPPLLESNGMALSLFLTDRFTLRDVIGRTVIVHDHPDDFTTQPSGNSGQKIACGVIQRVNG